MVLTIDALRVGSRDPPMATLDVSGNMRVSQDVQISQWNVGSLGILYGGLPANAAALSQTAFGQTTLSAAAGQTIQFADGGSVGLQYAQGSFLGNLSISGFNTDQVVQVQSNSSSTRKLRLMSSANGRVAVDTSVADLMLAANGSQGILVQANGGVSFLSNSVNLGNASVGLLQTGQIAGPTGVVYLNSAVGINQPSPAPFVALDCLGNVHVAGGGLRIDGTATSTPDLSLGYPGTLSMDSSGVVGGRLFIDNNGRANIGGPLNVNGAVSTTGQLNLSSGQVLSLNGDLNHTVQFDPATNGVRVQGYGGGVLGTSQTAANALSWTTTTCSTFLPFQVYGALTIAGNSSVVGPDPYMSFGNCVLAVSNPINAYSNVASPGDLVLKNKAGNLLLQTANNGGIYINTNNAVGVSTTSINPLVALDVNGAGHYGIDNVGSRIVNLAGRTFYSTVPTYRCLAVFYAIANAGNGAHLTVKGPCGPWSGARGELKLSITTSGGVTATSEWLGGVPAGIDVQVYSSGGVASVYVVVTTNYCAYNFDVTYGGQGYTSLAGTDTPTAPTGTLVFSSVATPTTIIANTVTSAQGLLLANSMTVGAAGSLSTYGNGYTQLYTADSTQANSATDWYSNYGNTRQNIARLRCDGNFVAYGYTNWSDARLKQNISVAQSVGDRLAQIPVRRFEWSGCTSGRNMWGVIAQELEPIFPELVTLNKEYKGVDSTQFSAILLKGVQELQARVTELEKKLSLNSTPWTTML